MKKHRKLVALLVALTFLFSIAAPVMAAAPSEAEKAADKLNVLGIIEGYPDGSFGVDRNITRAEFAKIAVVAAGLKDAAEQLVNFPSQFSDVKVGEWYTGWINMAASQGFVKGDPAGTFRPNDNITYAEVVTVLVRLLGYNDNLTGPWPTNYLAKAVELGITDGVALNASAPAVRGDVFIMTANTLDCNTVYWNADNLDWTVKAEKLIVKSFKGAMYEGIVTDISWDSKGDIYLDIVDNNGKDYGSIRLVDNVIISGADDAFGLLGKQVEFIRNQKASGADRNAIVYLGEKETESVSKDKAEYDVRYIEIDSKRYDVASGFGVTYFPVSGDFDPKEETTLTGDKVVVVLNEDGEAQWAFVYNYSAAGADVIEEIDGDKVFGFNKTRFEYDEDDIQVFIKDGKIASYDALAEGDLIYVVEDAKNTDALVFAVSEVLEGELEKANADTNELTISGTKIKTDSGYKNLISLDSGKTFDGDLEDVLGEAVKYMLNPAGRVAVIISDVKASQKLVGVVEATVNTARGLEVRILNPDGTKAVYYVDSDYSSDWRAVHEIGSTTNVLVQYSLDKNGRIDWVEKAKSYTFADYDGNRIQLDKWYRLDDNAGFFGYEGSKADPEVPGKLIASNWETFKGVKGEGITAIVDKGQVKAVYTTGVIKGTDVGVVADMGYDRNGAYYEIFVDGQKVRYNMAAKDATVDKDLKGKLVDFRLASGKISSVSVMEDVYTYKVDSASSNRILVDDGTYYYIDAEDTMIVDATGSTIKLVSRVGKGDYVQIYEGKDNKGVVEIILIVKAPKDEPAPTPPDPGLGDGGTVTYIDLTNKAIYIDGKAYVYSDNVVLKTAKGSIIATGETNVFAALRINDKVEIGKVVDGKVTELIGLQVASVQELADPINTEIEALPSVDKATLEDKTDVDTAKGNYDALAPYVKDFVKAENVAKLNALVAKMEQLQAEADAKAAQNAANTFKTTHAAVLALTVDTVATTNESDVDDALDAYDNLTPAAQDLLIKEKALLDSLKARIEAIDAVNDASSEAELITALEHEDLGLDLTAWNQLKGFEKNQVAQQLLEQIGSGKTFTKTAEVQAALDALL